VEIRVTGKPNHKLTRQLHRLELPEELASLAKLKTKLTEGVSLLA
jgi:hypothetical protein